MNYTDLRFKVYGKPDTYEQVKRYGRYYNDLVPCTPRYYTSIDQAEEFMEDITALLAVKLELEKARAVADIVVSRSDIGIGSYDFAMTLLQYYYFLATGEFLT